MAVLAYASASSSCIEVCSPTSVFHVRSFAAPVSAATTTSAAICQPIPTPYGASSPRQADRLPRVIRATFPAYTRPIYVLTFRMVSGFESCGPLAQVSPPLFASCTSGRRFAYSFLQIPPRDGHPCCSASSSHHQGLQRTCTAKSTKWPPQPIRSRLRATRHAWRTTESDSRVREPRLFCCRTAFWRGTASESSSEYAGTTLFSGSFGRCHSRWSYIAA
jgi:hypothetical protein